MVFKVQGAGTKNGTTTYATFQAILVHKINEIGQKITDFFQSYLGNDKTCIFHILLISEQTFIWIPSFLEYHHYLLYFRKTGTLEHINCFCTVAAPLFSKFQFSIFVWFLNFWMIFWKQWVKNTWKTSQWLIYHY